LSLNLSACSGIRYIDGVISSDKLSVPKSAFVEVKKDKTINHKFVVIRNPQLKYPVSVYQAGDGDFKAFYMQCTHQGCEINAYETQFVCPCHGSEFNLDGKVLQGPAEKDLVEFKVTADVNNIAVHLK
jgi:Rieske Fe-S protein